MELFEDKNNLSYFNNNKKKLNLPQVPKLGTLEFNNILNSKYIINLYC
jgi:hypothetical protein